MKEGDYINFRHDNIVKSGRVIKTYTQIGFSDHGKTFVIILLDNNEGLFKKGTIKLEAKNIERI
jgi:hypothetical protein